MYISSFVHVDKLCISPSRRSVVPTCTLTLSVCGVVGQMSVYNIGHLGIHL